MADYYGRTYSSPSGRRKNQRSTVGLLVDIAMGIVTLCVVALFVATLIVPTLDPREWGWVSTLGLVAPFVYAAQALLTLYWIVRWRVVVASLMLIISLCGIAQLSHFYKLEMRRVYTEPNLRPRYDSRALKVLSYNVRSFIDDNGERCIDSIISMIKTINPDIVCLQEMGFSDIADSLLEPLRPMPRSLSRVDLSPAIYSRYPIIRAGRIDSLKEFVWADIVVKRGTTEDTLRIFNNHLHTTAIRRDDSDYIENHAYFEDDSLGKMRSMIHRLADNNALRAAQADTLAQMVAASPYPAIVCGDFNDTPISYTYRTVSRDLRDAFRWAGRGYSHTYRGFFDMLRIDYIFSGEEFVPLSYEVIDSWTLEQSVRRRAGQRDTVWVRSYGNQMAEPTLEQAQQAQEHVISDSLGQRVDNRVRYSDHYPVFARILYNGKTN